MKDTLKTFLVLCGIAVFIIAIWKGKEYESKYGESENNVTDLLTKNALLNQENQVYKEMKRNLLADIEMLRDSLYENQQKQQQTKKRYENRLIYIDTIPYYVIDSILTAEYDSLYRTRFSPKAESSDSL